MNISDYAPATQKFFKNARDDLEKLDTEDVCRRTGAEYDQDKNLYLLPYLGHIAKINAKTASMEWGWPIRSLFHILLLHYLIHADGSKPKGQLISMHEAAPLGSTRVTHMINSSIPPLIKAFSGDLEAFLMDAEILGGKRISNNTVEIPIFPHLPIQITIWPEDDEFPADARILFDKTIRGQLTPEDIVYVGDIAVQALYFASGNFQPISQNIVM